MTEIGPSAKEDTVLVVGYSRPPADTPVHKVYETISIVMVVDRRTHTILSAEPSWVTNLGRDFFNNLLSGESILDSDRLTELVQKCCFARTKRAFINAMLACCESYRESIGAISPPAKKPD